MDAIPVLVKRCRPLDDGTFLLAVALPSLDRVVLAHTKITEIDFQHDKMKPPSTVTRRDGGWDSETIVGALFATTTLKAKVITTAEFEAGDYEEPRWEAPKLAAPVPAVEDNR